MQRTLYIRPVGIFPGRDETLAGDVWGGLPLAGGPLAFTAVEVIERAGAQIERRVIGLGDLFERDWGRSTLSASDMVEAVRAPRPRIGGLSLDRARIMGIVNVTPDSFSDGGQLSNVEAAISHALQLAEDGADILDIGGESTRPGADYVPVEEELRRVLPVIEGLRARTDKLISVDTRKAEVMRRAANAGADILNDVSGLTHDPDALEAAAESGLPIMLMHAQGDPKTMNDNPQYTYVVLDVFDFLEERIDTCVRAGIPKAKLIADPGIGFGKHLPDNIAVLAQMSIFHGLGVPILLGASRKKLIGQLCNVENPKDRVPGSIAAALNSMAQGIQIIRVHDVRETAQAVRVWEAVQAGSEDGLA